jgi:lysophospholipase L1-like esterase
MRVCFLGESFVNGTGDPECLGWTGRVGRAAWQHGHDVTYYNLGIRRETSTELRYRWLQEVERRLPPEVDGRVVFSFGTNDTTVETGIRRVELAESLDNLRAILGTAKTLFPVLMIGAPPIEDAEQTARIEGLSEQMSIVCHELEVPYLDVISKLKRSPIWMHEVAAYDGAHPSAVGYAEFASIVENWSAWKVWFNSSSS